MYVCVPIVVVTSMSNVYQRHSFPGTELCGFLLYKLIGQYCKGVCFLVFEGAGS